MSLLERARRVWAGRPILRLLVSRDLKVRYAGSWLGYLWTVLDPLAMACVYWFVFTVIFKSRQVGAQPYILFLVSGLLPWQWFAAVLTDASRALTAESKIVRSSNLPRELWVLRVVGSKGLEFLYSLPVLVFFMVVYRVPPSWYMLTLPFAMLLQAVLLTGIGLLLAPVTVLVNDMQRVVRIFLRIFFYLSPVIYGVHNIPEKLHPIYALNPMSGILDLYHAAVFPELFGGWWIVGISTVISVSVLFLGAWVFQRLEGPVLKEI